MHEKPKGSDDPEINTPVIGKELARETEALRAEAEIRRERLLFIDRSYDFIKARIAEIKARGTLGPEDREELERFEEQIPRLDAEAEATLEQYEKIGAEFAVIVKRYYFAGPKTQN